MAHPKEQATAVFGAAFKHGPIAVVVYPLGQVCELTCIGRLSKCFLKHLVEAFRFLCGACQAAKRVVVNAVHKVGMGDSAHRLHRLFSKSPDHVLVVHHRRHSALGVHLVVAVHVEVFLHGFCVVGASAANAVSRGVGDVKHARMLLRDHFPQVAVDFLRRVALVPAHVQGYGRMVPYAPYITGCNLIEAGRIGRIRSVPGVGQPEILPDHYAVTVAGVVEGLVVRHANPVADHGEIHVGMVANGNIVLAVPILQKVLRISPVAAKSNESPAVHVHAQPLVLVAALEGTSAHGLVRLKIAVHLADAGEEGHGVGDRTIGHKLKRNLI